MILAPVTGYKYSGKTSLITGLLYQGAASAIYGMDKKRRKVVIGWRTLEPAAIILNTRLRKFAYSDLIYFITKYGESLPYVPIVFEAPKFSTEFYERLNFILHEPEWLLVHLSAPREVCLNRVAIERVENHNPFNFDPKGFEEDCRKLDKTIKLIHKIAAVRMCEITFDMEATTAIKKLKNFLILSKKLNKEKEDERR